MPVWRIVPYLGFDPNEPPDVFLVTVLGKPIGLVEACQLFFLMPSKPFVCMLFYVLQTPG